MAGIGQSSVPSSDQSTPWNSSQFNMGRSGSIDNHSSIQTKYYSMTDKRPFSDQRLISEENGALPQNMYQQFNRQQQQQQTGFLSSNTMSNDKSYISNLQSNMNLSSIGNAMNYNMYSRNINDSTLYQPNNLDVSSSQSKQGFSSNSSRMGGGLPQYMENSLSNHSYLSPTPYRTISGGNMIPTSSALFNGQNISSKSRTGTTYNFESNSASLAGQWDTQIGNFDSADFPCLNKPKLTASQQLSQMSGNYNYNLQNKSGGPINYQQMVMKTGSNITPGGGGGSGGEHSNEFSIQQEDFPALPVAQSQTSSTMLRPTGYGNNNLLDPIELQKLQNTYYDMQLQDSSSTLVQPSSVSSSSISSSNNSSQPNKSIQKKIIKGPNNYITNIPSDMVSDAFGLIGLVKLIGINDTHENLNLLAPGVDTLSLNRELSSTRDIFHSYVSPLNSNCAGRPHDMDYPVPKEYRVRHLILDKLADPLPEKLSDETLFWIFYNLTGEECQTTAAKQLMARQWRYNKRDKYWLTRDSKGVTDSIVQSNLERGSYIVWDHEKSQRVSKLLTVYYKDLESITPANTKSSFPFCYNSPFLKRSSVNNSIIPSSQMPTSGGGRPSAKNMTAFLQQSSPADSRLLNLVASSHSFPPIIDQITPTSSQIRVQINNHAPIMGVAVSQQQQQQQQQQQSTQ